jgi:hypothetical protein
LRFDAKGSAQWHAKGLALFVYGHSLFIGGQSMLVRSCASVRKIYVGRSWNVHDLAEHRCPTSLPDIVFDWPTAQWVLPCV